MLLLPNATDKLQLVTSAAATIDCHASYMDHTLSNDNVEGNRQNTAITTAATTDIVAAPAAGAVRNVKTLHLRNKHASMATDVTIVYNANGTSFELYKVNLLAGDALEYVEGLGFFVLRFASKFETMLVVTSDVTNATVSFADVTGLTCPVEAGKTYVFDACLHHINNATTTGSQFGVNGPAMTNLIASNIDTVTSSATASVHSAGTVTAVETPITAQTTGMNANRPALIAGGLTPSASGTFAMRFRSEVAVAAGIIVKRGSYMRVREADNA